MNNSFNIQKKIDAYNQRQHYLNRGYNNAKKHDILHIKACILYWAEGSKSSKSFEFTNCEPETHLIIINFLHKYFPHLKLRIRGRINFYPSEKNSYDRVRKYWIDKLGIPENQFNKPTDRSRYYKEPIKNKYPNGIMKIQISSVELLYYIYGAINYYCGSNIFSASTSREN